MFRHIIPTIPRINRVLLVLFVAALCNFESLAADKNKLSADDVAKKWEARKAGTLTDEEFVRLVKGKFEFDTDGVNNLQKSKLKPDEIDMMKKILSAVEDNFSLFQVMAGVKLENPYSIAVTPAVPPAGGAAGTPASATLKPNNTKTDGFFELSFSTRYIYRTGKYVDNDPAKETAKDAKIAWGIPFGFKRHFAPEMDFSVGYVIRGSDAPTSITTSTITGGSDFYSDLAVGLPVGRLTTEDQRLKVEFGLELGAGFSTDKGFDRAHPNFFEGVGFQIAKLQSATQTSAGDVYFTARVGVAEFDRPRLSGTSVVLDQFDLPRFEKTEAAAAGINFVYRISESVLLRAGGNVFFKERAAWNLSAALSVDPSKFFPSKK